MCKTNKILVLFLLSLIFVWSPGSATAAVFCVDTPVALQSALTTAGTNGEDDTVLVVQGTYVGNFIYDSTEPFNFSIGGGFTAACASRSVDPANTILDGNNSGTVISLKNGLNGGGFNIEGLMIINGNIANYGGGLYILAGDATANIINNIMIDNYAAISGGGAYIDAVNGNVTITNNTIMNNSSLEYAGLWASGILTITNNVIFSNIADGGLSGGGMFVSGRAKIVNNSIVGNSAGSCGGIIVIQDNDAIITDIYNNIILWNGAVNAKDICIYNDWDGNGVPGTVNLFNNNFNNFSDGIYIQIPFALDPSNLNQVDPGVINVDLGNLRLRATSEMINKGSNGAPGLPTQDKDGNARIAGAVVDIGAYEFQGPFSLDPIPDIKANGVDGPITIAPTDTLSVTVTLDSVDSVGRDADWWALADTPFGWYRYDLSTKIWVPGSGVTYQGALFDLPTREVLNMSGLPVGTYTLSFEVDLTMNAIKDAPLYSDSVEVTVAP